MDNGSKLRILNLLRGLSQNHEVTLLSLSENKDINIKHPHLRALCRDVKVVPKKIYAPIDHISPRSLLSSTPRFIRDTFSPEMANAIQKSISANGYDFVIASQLGTASYRPYYRKLPALFEEVEIGVYYQQFSQAKSIRGKIRHGLTWVKHRKYLAELLQDFDLCTVVSEQEKQLLVKAVPGGENIHTIPNFIDLNEYKDIRVRPQTKKLIFSGSFHYLPNYEAMLWFLEQVFPLVQARVPDAELTITGDPASYPLPSIQNITQTGFVEDVRPVVASAWVCIVPLQTGGGTRLKILEAMALGVPVVSTTKGAEGLDILAGQHLLIGDTPETFSENILCLFQDLELRLRIIDQARKLIKEKYDHTAVFPKFETLIQGFYKT
jgi:polysaccharide biosynthesis protein PslH